MALGAPVFNNHPGMVHNINIHKAKLLVISNYVTSNLVDVDMFVHPAVLYGKANVDLVH